MAQSLSSPRCRTPCAHVSHHRAPPRRRRRAQQQRQTERRRNRTFQPPGYDGLGASSRDGAGHCPDEAPRRIASAIASAAGRARRFGHSLTMWISVSPVSALLGQWRSRDCRCGLARRSRAREGVRGTVGMYPFDQTTIRDHDQRTHRPRALSSALGASAPAPDPLERHRSDQDDDQHRPIDVEHGPDHEAPNGVGQERDARSPAPILGARADSIAQRRAVDGGRHGRHPLTRGESFPHVAGQRSVEKPAADAKASEKAGRNPNAGRAGRWPSSHSSRRPVKADDRALAADIAPSRSPRVLVAGCERVEPMLKSRRSGPSLPRTCRPPSRPDMTPLRTRRVPCAAARPRTRSTPSGRIEMLDRRPLTRTPGT